MGRATGVDGRLAGSFGLTEGGGVRRGTGELNPGRPDGAVVGWLCGVP